MSYTGRHRAMRSNQTSIEYLAYAVGGVINPHAEQPQRSRAKRGYKGEHRENNQWADNAINRYSHNRDDTNSAYLNSMRGRPTNAIHRAG